MSIDRVWIDELQDVPANIVIRDIETMLQNVWELTARQTPPTLLVLDRRTGEIIHTVSEERRKLEQMPSPAGLALLFPHLKMLRKS